MNAHNGAVAVFDEPTLVPMTNVWYPLTLQGYALFR
jgi:hypothetical protein